MAIERVPAEVHHTRLGSLTETWKRGELRLKPVKLGLAIPGERTGEGHFSHGGFT